MRYLLDTNVLSALIRAPTGPILRRIEAVGAARVYTSVVVAAEMRFRAARKGSQRLTTEVEAILGRIAVAEIKPPVDRVYAALRHELEARGRPMGTNDLWIAAQAIHDGSVVATGNVGEFGRVPGLTIEDWTRA